MSILLYNNSMDKQELIKYLKSLGLKVNTKTKARGHQGFFTNNRIDISINTPENKVMPVLIHEFAHFIHSKIEPDINKSGGNIHIIFQSNNPILKNELLKVTNFVDNNSLCIKLFEHKDRIKSEIKKQEEIIRAYYPDFQRSKNFKQFDKFIKKSAAKYLLKFDIVKVVEHNFFKKNTKIYSIKTIENDFPNMPKAFIACIRLKSLQRKQSKISNKINRLKKYYERPTELFARFVEGLYLDKEWVEAIAPNTCKQFYNLLDSGFYKELKNVIPCLNAQMHA